MAELTSRRDAASRADMVELRLDGVPEVDVVSAIAGRRAPVVVTCRPDWEGGRHRGVESGRLSLLQEALAAGAELVDVEWRAEWRPLDGHRLVLSLHDFDGLPDRLAERVEAMRAAAPAAVVKVAVAARRVSDCIGLRDAMPERGRHVAIAMGAAGLITRVCPWLFGSCWTYTGSSAPGQLPTAVLRDAFRVGETSSATRVFGVVGPWPAACALAAAQAVELRRRGVDAVAVPLAVADARDLEAAAEAFGIGAVSEASEASTGEDPAARAARDVDRWMRTGARAGS